MNKDEMKKEIITRKKVNAKAFQKTAVTDNSRRRNKTLWGKGSISGAFINPENTYHTSTRKKREINLQNFILVILWIIKILSR